MANQTLKAKKEGSNIALLSSLGGKLVVGAGHIQVACMPLVEKNMKTIHHHTIIPRP
jgi:hypothetical protein